MSGHDSFGLDVIGQIAVPVSDVNRAIAFYRDILGMRFLFKAPPGLGFFDCSGVRLLLDEPVRNKIRITARSSITKCPTCRLPTAPYPPAASFLSRCPS